jgi:tetratricopeptide (TPR) repeat protein
MNDCTPQAIHPESDNFDSGISRDLDSLALLIQETDANLIAFVLYRDLRNRKHASTTLKQRLNLPVAEFSLTPQDKNPFHFLSTLPFTERCCIFLYGLEEALPEAAGYFNLQREALLTIPHAVVVWVTEYGLQQVASLSPDFWAWRSGVFDLRIAAEISPQAFVEQLIAKDVVFHNRQDLERKISLYQDLLHEYQKKLPIDGHLLVGLRLKLANAYYDLGQYQKAIEHAKQALQLANKILDQDHPDMAASLNSLGLYYTAQGRYAEAETLHQRALQIIETALGPHHTHVATSLNNLALLNVIQGKYAEAESLFRRSLEIREKVLGTDHPDVANSFNNLAGLYDNQGKYDKAELLYQRTLQIVEKALGQDHPNVATGLENYAALLRQTSRKKEAALLEEQARAIRAKHEQNN